MREERDEGGEGRGRIEKREERDEGVRERQRRRRWREREEVKGEGEGKWGEMGGEWLTDLVVYASDSLGLIVGF